MAEPNSSAGLLGLVRPSAGGPEAEPMPEADPAEDGLQAASDEVFDALEGGDRLAFREALRRFVSIAGMAPSDDEEL